MTRTPYEVLGVAPGAEIEEIHRAYLALARQHHPDAGGNAAEMQRVNEAWALLSDRRRRRRYDEASARTAAGAAAAADDPSADAADADGSDETGRFADFAGWPRRVVRATRRDQLIDTLTLLAVMASAASAALSFVFGVIFGSSELLGFCMFSLFFTGIWVLARALLAMRFDGRAG